MNRNERFESLLSKGEKAELHHISGEINKFMVELVKKKAQQEEKGMEGNEKKGMWILYSPNRYSATTVNFRCSQCRVIVKLPGYPVPECPYKYCPHCGSRNYNPHESRE